MTYYIYITIIAVISVTITWYSKSYFLKKIWDKTPFINWKLSLNPLNHINFIWLILFNLIWFWWWNKIDKNYNYIKLKGKYIFISLFSWILTNLILAIIWTIFIVVLWKYIFWYTNLIDIIISNNEFILFIKLFIFTNINLIIINLLPYINFDLFDILKVYKNNFANIIENNWHIFTIIFIVIFISPIFWDKLIEYINILNNIIYKIILWIIASIIM